MIESMAIGTVSFEELLGHCNELYKKNETNLFEIEDRFMDFGYVPEVEIEDEEEDVGLKTPTGVDSKLFSSTKDGLDFSCGRGSIMKRLEENPMYLFY
ncbi:hypothetical protein IFM89_029114 [Coptis chinensis]|uniref:Spindle and kinetochore-associated protein 3 n=1 Tax=Coptis chinensis TaxID=261450 RepID=A0A835GYN0_9MAGN|nr:hypothetical protein IFM89_029114 [Coptis chinensis]